MSTQKEKLYNSIRNNQILLKNTYECTDSYNYEKREFKSLQRRNSADMKCMSYSNERISISVKIPQTAKSLTLNIMISKLTSAPGKTFYKISQ